MTDDTQGADLPERGPQSMTLAAAGEIGFNQNGVSLSPETLGQVVGFSRLMATAAHAIPKHLRGNPGACMAVTMDAMNLRMNPFLLARKSYCVNDILAYEAQVISAAINTSSITVRRPTISYDGDGDTRRCTVVLHLKDGDTDPTTSPQVSKILPKNSPLWKSDPDQQLAYYTIRAAGRRHCPEVMLGMLDIDEAVAAAPLDIETHEAPARQNLQERLAARTTVDERGFNVRNADEAATGKPGRKKADPKPKPEIDALAAIAEAEPEIVAQVIEDHADGPQDQGTAGALIVESEPATSGSASDASSDSQAESSGLKAQDDPSSAGEQQQVEPDQETLSDAPLTGQVILAEAAPVERGPFADFWDDIQGAGDWLAVKTCLKAVLRTEEFRALGREAQNEMRGAIWLEVEAKDFAVDHTSDVTAFRLWMETQQGAEGIAAIEEAFAALKTDVAWLAMGETDEGGAVQESLTNTVELALRDRRGT